MFRFEFGNKFEEFVLYNLVEKFFNKLKKEKKKKEKKSLVFEMKIRLLSFICCL